MVMMDRKTRTRFDRVRRAASSLRRRTEEDMNKDNGNDGMVKYGYDKKNEKEDPGTKIAADRSVCPKCGSPVSGQPPICPKCGSEPFERKEKGG